MEEAPVEKEPGESYEAEKHLVLLVSHLTSISTHKAFQMGTNKHRVRYAGKGLYSEGDYALDIPLCRIASVHS